MRTGIAVPPPVLVLGGSGFIGRHVVARLVAAGQPVTVLTRRRASARHLILLPTVDVVEGDCMDRDTLMRLCVPAVAVINLVGILHERGTSTFARVHVDLPRLLVDVCKAAGVQRIVHMSAVGADARGGASRYMRSKGEGEDVVAHSGLEWTILRPSIVFGREDRFLNLFARLARSLPLLAIGGADARFQPIYVRDLAACVEHVLNDDATIGQRYSLCGPKAYSLRELVSYAGEVSGHRRPVIGLPPAAAKLQALALELLPGTLMSRDNLASMTRDNVCEGPFPSIFGFAPTALEAVAPTYLAPDAIKSPYDEFREHSGR
ncbi:MAG TPA: complex I NDUFA9 subunit family protein [Casimicrobiaceae bacterium]|nr:complex I NDUFA9 subunit family protein [Casimicrobiaceae bacterium]